MTGTLSPREAAVMRLVARGLVEKEIAHRLAMSRYTVHGHVRSIYDKLGVHNHAQAVAVLDDRQPGWRA